MSSWTDDELERIGSIDELQLASERGDGSLREPVTMWVARDGGNVYVRAVNGRTSPWFRGAQTRHLGHLTADGVGRDVALEDVDGDTWAAVDAAYRAKYGSHAHVGMVLTDQAREATLLLVPR
jgi:hypothetical protein